MGKKIIFVVLLVAGLVPWKVQSKPRARKVQRGSIVVSFSHLRNSKGTIWVSLFASKKGFPNNPKKAFRKGKGAIKKKRCTVTFTNVPYRTYAIAVIHDENNNGKLDKNWMGIPKEGYSASNNARGRMGPPSFRQARFSLKKPKKTMTIKMFYF